MRATRKSGNGAVLPDFTHSFARRETIRWDGVPVSMIGLEDLIASKKAVGRERDQKDLKALEAVRRNRAGA